MSRRAAKVGSTFVTVAVLLVVGCGGDTTPRSIPLSSPSPAPLPLILSAGEATASPSDAPPLATEEHLTSEGEAVTEPGRLSIESIDVDADLVGVGLLSDGSMETPEYHTNTAGWYTEGPPPGSPGPAVIAAHVDGPNGTDVFYDLEDISPGDEIVVTDEDGTDHTFVVDRLTTADKDELPYDEIWPDTDEILLTLITCDGPYVDGEYEDNLIVYAEKA